MRGLLPGMMEVQINSMHTIPELGRTYGGDGELGWYWYTFSSCNNKTLSAIRYACSH